MKPIPQYSFYRNKYGEKLLVDVVELDFIKKHIPRKIAHTLTYYDITFITEGSGYFTIDHKRYHVKPGNVIFSIAGEVREWDTENIHRGFALIFEEEFLTSFFNDPCFVVNLSYFNPERKTSLLELNKSMFARILSLVNHIRTEINEFIHKDEHILRAQLYETLMLLHREFIKATSELCCLKSKKIPARHMNLFVRLVNRYYKINRNTSYYADKLCITPNYLNEIVRESVGISAKVYIQNKILLEAKRLLSYTDMSVREISEELNFDNVSYFIRFFGKHAGVTPLQFRKGKSS